VRQGSQLPAPHIRRRIPSTPHSPTPREEPARTTSKGRAGVHLSLDSRNDLIRGRGLIQSTCTGVGVGGVRVMKLTRGLGRLSLARLLRCALLRIAQLRVLQTEHAEHTAGSSSDVRLIQPSFWQRLPLPCA
jgi:hypothetical protein